MIKCKVCGMEFENWDEFTDHRKLHEEQIEDEWRGIFQKFT